MRTRALSETRDDLLRGERLAALGQAPATVGQELRTPLATITSSIAVVRRGGIEGERADRAFARIERSIARCAEIVNELLDITHEQPLDRHPTPVRRWLESALRDVETSLGTPVALDAPVEAEVPIDTHRMAQVLTNLLQNAAHATLERHPAAPPPLRLRARLEDTGWLVLAVEDERTEMTPEVRTRAFEPLFTTKSTGIGLGMPLVRKLVEQHGGKVTVRTEPGTGTTDTVRLPTR